MNNSSKNFFNKLKDLLTLGTANIITAILSAAFWFFLASLLGSNDYGNVAYLITVSSVTYVVSFLGIGNTIIVYTSKEQSSQSSLFFISIISGIIASIVLFTIFQNISMTLYVIGFVIFGTVTSDLLGWKRYKDYAIYMIAHTILQIVLSISLYYLIGIDGIILGFGLSYFLFFYRFIQVIQNHRISILEFRTKFKFMMGSYGLELSRKLSQSLDKLLILPLFGYSLLGNYQLGFQILLLMNIIPQTIFQYTLAHDAEGKHNKKLKIYTVYFAIVVSIIGVTVTPFILSVLYPEFVEAQELIQIMSLTLIPMTIRWMITSKLMGLEKTRPVLLSSVMNILIQIVLIFVLSGFYGINGIAIAILVANIAHAAYLLVVDYRNKKLNV